MTPDLTTAGFEISRGLIVKKVEFDIRPDEDSRRKLYFPAVLAGTVRERIDVPFAMTGADTLP